MNRRLLLGRLARYGSVFGLGSAGNLGLALAQRAVKKPQDSEDTESDEEEEKKKSTLVSDVEEFGRGRTRIALLLPNIEGPYRFAADAVLRGFQAAHAIDGRGIYVKVIRTEEDAFPDVEAVYRELQKERFSFVVGPLIRTTVNALGIMPELPLPTLMLNLPDQGVPIPANSVLFSLAIEYEGHSAARYAFAEAYQRVGPGRPLRALPISDKQVLSKRSMDAFIEAWQAYGGEVETPIVQAFATEEQLRDLIVEARADVVFAAMPPETMRILRPAIAPFLPIYATSRMNTGALPTVVNAHLIATPELDGIRVIEMPWQLMPDHPAVALYPRSRRLPHVEMQRLYAFGIDAYRVSRELLGGREQFELDGVTGRLILDTTLDPRVAREPTLGEYRQGILAPAYAPEAPGGVEQTPDPNAPGLAPAPTR